MSILQVPRINFFGEISWNPNTVNNSRSNYSQKTADPKGPGADDLGPDFTEDYNGYVEWLTTYDENKGRMPGDWDVFGNYGVKCENVTVQSVVLHNAQAPDTNDPLVGKTFSIHGNTVAGGQDAPARLVDVNAYGSSSSQIFFDRLALGDSLGLVGNRSTRMYSRWIWFNRNLAGIAIAGNAGVIFQTGIHAGDIDWGADYAQSPALVALRQTVEAGNGCKGILMQCAAYTTLYFSTQPGGPALHNADIPAFEKALSERFANGDFVSNPAVSTLTGSIGLWHEGELSVNPTDRYLKPLGSNFGPATAARTDNGEVMVNLINGIQENDVNNDKRDVGELILQLQPADGSGWQDLGKPVAQTRTGDALFAYGKADYEQSGGIIGYQPDGYVNSQDIDDGILRMVHRSTYQKTGKQIDVPFLTEDTLRAGTNQHGVYIDEDQTISVTVNVYQKGKLYTGGDAKIMLSQFSAALNISKIVGNAQGQSIDNDIVNVDTNGQATFELTATGEGATYLVYTPFIGDAPQPPESFDSVNDAYSVVRGMPFDNALEASVSDADLTFDWLYENVLYTWDLTYPAMSQVRSLHDEQTFNSMADLVAAAISEDRFESGGYMPISRDMSAGKRCLIQRYINNLS